MIYERYIVSTKTTVKEASFNLGVLAMMAIYTYSTFIIDTYTFLGEKYVRYDILRDMDYRYMILIYSMIYVVHTIDSVVLVCRAVGKRMDVVIPGMDAVYYMYVYAYSSRYHTSHACGEKGHKYNTYRCLDGDGRLQESMYDMEYVSMGKMVVDVCVYVWFVCIYYKYRYNKYISMHNGMSASRIMIDVQVYMIVLWMKNGYGYNDLADVLNNKRRYSRYILYPFILYCTMFLPASVLCAYLSVRYTRKNKSRYMCVSYASLSISCLLMFVHMVILSISYGCISCTYIRSISYICICILLFTGVHMTINTIHKIILYRRYYYTYMFIQSDCIPLYIHTTI